MKREDLLATLDIGATVKQLRELRGISQEELAKGICDRTNITKLENGYSKIPSLSFILLICEKLEISLNDFVNAAMNNSYTLDKKYILDLLMQENINKLNEFTSSINYELLTNKDKQYYYFLMMKIALESKNITKAKDYFKLITKDTSLNSINNLQTISLHLLIKNNLINIDDNVKNKIYSKNKLLELTNKNTPLEYLFFINDLLKDCIVNGNKERALFLLEVEIKFINSHDCYKYLPYYYKNKIQIYSNNKALTKDLERKIFAINQTNI